MSTAKLERELNQVTYEASSSGLGLDSGLGERLIEAGAESIAQSASGTILSTSLP